MFACKNPSRKSSHVIQNQNLLRLRLSYQEKIYYTDLFMLYQDNKTGNVYLENFPKLLGIFGTDIAEDIAKRIFEIFSGNKDYITLSEYLKYIDVYHYGDETERCNVTCKLMDFNNNGNITLPNFTKYINLIIGAVRKVNPGLKSELFSEEDIEVLFNKISNNKDYFTYDEFAMVYNEKPELLSWIDYFKNDSNDILLIIHKNIKKIIKNLYNFNYKISNLFKNYRHKNFDKGGNNDKKKEFFDLIIEIQKLFNAFKKDVNLQNEEFLQFARNNQISLRNLFSIITENEQNDEESVHNDDDNIIEEKDETILSCKNNELSPLNLFASEEIRKTKNNNIDNFNKRNQRKRIATIKNFFDDIKKNLNFAKNNGIRRQSYQVQNFLKNKLFKESKKNNKIIDFNTENESSEMSDFIISEEEEQEVSAFNKNINVLKAEISLNKLNNLQSQARKESIEINNEVKPILKLSNESEENKQNFEESTKNKTFKENIGILLKHTCSARNNSVFSGDEKEDKLFKYLDKLIKYFESSSKIFSKSIINLNESYKWIELRYLRKTIISQRNIKKIESKKEQLTKDKDLKVNKNNEKRLKFIAVKNIPKNRLKTTDDSFKILLNTIMGIQIAVESTPDISEIRDINQFLNSMTYSIQTANLSKNKQEIFMIKEYSGIVFNSIRKLYGYDKESFIQSISPQVFITEMIISNTTSIEELFNTGSSGSLFYYTRDGKLILKTISESEYKTMKRILPDYYNHLIKYKNSFLPKFFGCYKLIKKVKKKKIFVYFIIMMNVFSTSKQIHLRFDLKGSTLGREVLSQKEKNKYSYDEILGKYSFSLKDLDFDYFKKKIYIYDSICNEILNQLNADSLLLKKCNLNDYSLLIGIHKKKNHHINNLNTNINFDNDENNVANDNKTLSFSSHNSKKKITQNKKNIVFDDNSSSECVSITSINSSMYKNNSHDSLKIDKPNNHQHDIILKDNGIYNEKHREIYYIGIIDILTNYSALKKCEFCYKSIRYCTDQMSCVSPDKYQKRFISYLKQKIVPSSQDNEEVTNFIRKRKKLNTINENKNCKIQIDNKLNINLNEDLDLLSSKNKSEFMLNKCGKYFNNIIQ